MAQDDCCDAQCDNCCNNCCNSDLVACCDCGYCKCCIYDQHCGPCFGFRQCCASEDKACEDCGNLMCLISCCPCIMVGTLGDKMDSDCGETSDCCGLFFILLSLTALVLAPLAVPIALLIIGNMPVLFVAHCRVPAAVFATEVCLQHCARSWPDAAGATRRCCGACWF